MWAGRLLAIRSPNSKQKMDRPEVDNYCDFWSTQPQPSYQPTGGPLAEPPIFDYQHFIKINRNEIPSDGRLKRLSGGYWYRV